MFNRKSPEKPKQVSTWVIRHDGQAYDTGITSPDDVTQSVLSTQDEHEQRTLLQSWAIEAMNTAGPEHAIEAIGRIATVCARQPVQSPRSQQFFDGLVQNIAVVQQSSYGSNEVLGLKAGLGIMGQVKGE
jgi:hypothetical protein